MASPVSKLVAKARAAYRTLPIGLRMRVGRGLRVAIVEPALARMAPRPDPGPFPPARAVSVIGTFHAPLGHAQVAHLCAAELEAAGVPVARLDAGRALNLPSAEGEQPDIQTDAVVVAFNPDSMTHVMAHLGPAPIKGKRVVGYWVWELETAPARWRALADHLAHEIWAPSRFAAHAIERVFKRTVHVVPHPSAVAPPPPRTPERRARARDALGVREDCFLAFTSFSLTSSLARKNPEAAIAAFRKAFDGQRGDAMLVIRFLGGDRFPAARKHLLALARDAGPRVKILEGQGLEELHDLYAGADCYVSLHRSEGFGLNLAEAMLLGLPVVATGWSGNLDFMDDDCAAMVPPRALIPVRDPQRVYTQRGAVWADPDIDAAVAHLRALAGDRDGAIQLGARALAAAQSRLKGGAAAAALRQPYTGGG